MADGRSLVPDIQPLLQGLQQFTPQAQQDRQFQMQGLEQQQQLRDVQIQQVQQSNKRQQILDTANEVRIEFIKDRNDLEFVLKKGPEWLRNARARLAGTKEEGDPDLEELIEFANKATADPEAAFKELQQNQEGIGLQLKSIDEILGFHGAEDKGFTLGEGQKRFDSAGNLIATGTDKSQDGRSTLSQVQSSDILPTGATVQVFKDGSTRVTGPQGQPLTGQAREDAVRDAQEFGIDVQSRRAGGRAEATGAEQRAGKLITRGIAAAESTATIRRALTLLDDVKTGGVAAITLATKQKLGIEGANEGELSNSLGKSVLSQLRETFGAAFTENEGQRLERIEAGFGKSAATNRRLLGQALKIAEATAKRASKTAKDRGRTAEAADIEDLLNFSLDLEEEEVSPPGLVDNGDGTFTTQDGQIVRRTGG